MDYEFHFMLIAIKRKYRPQRPVVPHCPEHYEEGDLVEAIYVIYKCETLGFISHLLLIHCRFLQDLLYEDPI